MKMRQKMLLLFCVFIMTVWCLAPSVSAKENTEQTVFDLGNLLSEEERQSLAEETEKLQEEHKMNFIVLTTFDAQGKSARDYADDFYMDQGFYEDGKKGGIAFLIDMDNRELWISTAGDMRYYVSDAEVEEILDAGYPWVGDGQYYRCFTEMLDCADTVVDRGLSSKDYLIDENGNITRYRSITPFEILFGFAAALLAAGIPCAVILGRYKVRTGKYSYNWKSNSDVRITDKQDYFVNQIVTRRRIPKNPPPSAGGLGGGGSSIHTSSGGGSFGGGGRKF